MCPIRSPRRTRRRRTSSAQGRHHRGIVRRAQRNHRMCNPTILLLAVQAQPGEVPLSVELRITEGEVELVRRDKSGKREFDGEDEDERVNVKRRRVGESPLMIEGQGEGETRNALILEPPTWRTEEAATWRRQRRNRTIDTRDEEDQDGDEYLYQFQEQREDQDNRDKQDQPQYQDAASEELLIPQYIFDLGVIQAYPTENDTLTTKPIPKPPSPHRRITQSALIITSILSIVCILHCLVTAWFPSPTPCQVDWFTRAAHIEMGLAGLSRILLFGESDQPYHPCGHKGANRPPNPYKNIPRYGNKPWVTTSNGSYVSETLFLQDLDEVLFTALENLQEIANFGPRDFLFSSGSSTQFRWSTSAGEFISPHVALPTFPVNMTELETPGGTVPGMPPTTGDQQQATPTARPESVNHIYNVDPGLGKLQRDLEITLRSLLRHHSQTYELFTGFFLNAAADRSSFVVAWLEQLERDLARGGCLNGMWQSAPTPEYGAELATPSDVRDEYIKSDRECKFTNQL